LHEGLIETAVTALVFALRRITGRDGLSDGVVSLELEHVKVLLLDVVFVFRGSHVLLSEALINHLRLVGHVRLLHDGGFWVWLVAEVACVDTVSVFELSNLLLMIVVLSSGLVERSILQHFNWPMIIQSLSVETCLFLVPVFKVGVQVMLVD
jgi:hypothetical protein